VISNFCKKKKVNVHSRSKFLCHGLSNTTSLHSIQTFPIFIHVDFIFWYNDKLIWCIIQVVVGN